MDAAHQVGHRGRNSSSVNVRLLGGLGQPSPTAGNASDPDGPPRRLPVLALRPAPGPLRAPLGVDTKRTRAPAASARVMFAGSPGYASMPPRPRKPTIA